METYSQPNSRSNDVVADLRERFDALSREELYRRLHAFQVEQKKLERQLVTIRKELESAETELYRHEQEFKALSEHSPDIIVRSGRDSRYLYVNAAFEAATGIPALRTIGKTYRELGLSGDAYAFWEKNCLEVFERGQEQVMEFDLPTPKGIRWYHARIVPEPDEDGHVKTVLSIAHDMSDRKRAEEELRIYQKYLKNLAEQRTKEIALRNEELQREIEERKRIEERLRFTEFSVERSSIATVWLEADGTIFRINNATCQLLGYSHQELLSMNIYDFETDLPRRIPEDGWNDFWQRLIQEHHFDREFQYKRQDSELRVFEMSNNYFEYNGRAYCLAFLRDISERKQDEAELQQAKEAAEAANRAKSVFLANMSHEFRTPLNAILGYTQILKREQSLTAKQHEIIETMHASGEHLLLIINDILDLSKIEAQKIELEPKEFHLPFFLKNIVEMCRVRAQQQHVFFKYEISTDLPDSVLGDEKYLRQILLNLLGNAIKFTRQGGVTLRVKRVTTQQAVRQSTIHKPQSTIRFEVEDTGIGIPVEQIEKIFLPFHQGQERLAYTEGTGLGLAISQRLVRIMKAELHVESTVGKGSVFWFDLELPEIHGAHFQPGFEKQQIVVGVKGEPPTVLIVDDKKENRMLLKDILSPLGLEVLEARDGREALDMTLAHSPDVILMDLIMPGMDGLDTTRRIRQTAGFDRALVIAVSASVFAQTRKECLDVGCDDFISKPVQFEELLQKLSTHLNLEWVYRDEQGLCDTESEEEKSVPLVAPAREELVRLLNLAMMGDIMSIQEYAEDLKMREPELTPFSDKLERLANDFLVEEIQLFLQHYTEEGL